MNCVPTFPLPTVVATDGISIKVAGLAGWGLCGVSGASPIGFDVELRGEYEYNHGAVKESFYEGIGDRRWVRLAELDYNKIIKFLGWRTT